MAECSICGEPLAPGSWTCSLCGTTVPGQATATEPAPAPRQTQTILPMGEVLAPDTRLCPGCGQTYGPDYGDSFCKCGIELILAEQLPAAILEDTAPAPARVEATDACTARTALVRPPAGTRCLVLYDADKEPVQYFPLDKEAVLIGRLDAVDGNFPDIDVTEWIDAALARKVSRKHALILHSRATGGYTLRPLVGNTGTQIDTDMVLPLTDCPLENGRRIILGGAVRFKFEVM